jgi:hypothetical protein
MRDIVGLCPDVFVNQYLVVAAIDCGVPWLTEAQRAKGWELRSELAYSPRLDTVEDLFFQLDGPDSPGYDEWYLFGEQPPPLGQVQKGNPFEKDNEPRPGLIWTPVRWLGFNLHAPDPEFFHRWFWAQLEWMNPDSYVSDGIDNLNFVSRNEAVFLSVHQRLSASLGSPTT